MPGSRSVHRALWFTGMALAVLGGSWYAALTSSFGWDELVLGGSSALLAGAAGMWMAGDGGGTFQFKALWFKNFAGLPWRVLMDSAVVFAAGVRSLFKPPHPGVLLKIPFEPGAETPLNRARRALVVMGICATPNTMVVAGEREDHLVVHQRVPARLHRNSAAPREWPV